MSSNSAFPPVPDQEPDDDLDYLKFSSDSDIGLSPGEETDDASENESYQHHEYSQFTEIKEQRHWDISANERLAQTNKSSCYFHLLHKPSFLDIGRHKGLRRIALWKSSVLF